MTSPFIESCQSQFELLKTKLATENFQDRQKAFENFIRLGLPVGKEEEWKYLKFFDLQNQAFLLPQDCLNIQPEAISAYFIPDTVRLVFINGFLAESLSDEAALNLILKETESSNLIPNSSFNDAHAFAALNEALHKETLRLHLKSNTKLSQPLHILWFNAEDSAGIYPRLFIHLEANAELTLCEEYIGFSGRSLLNNAYKSLILDSGARLEHYFIQQQSYKAFDFHFQTVLQKKDSFYKAFVYLNGGTMGRFETSIQLVEKGAYCELRGLTVGQQKQQQNIHLHIAHQAPKTTSKQYFKNIAADQSKTIFNGKVKVFPLAHKVDAKQLNKNLLLSKLAEIDSRPQLEIDHDEVVCSHGATIGQLDENALFYLQSRGISEADARAMMIYAFAFEVLEGISMLAIREKILNSMTSIFEART